MSDGARILVVDDTPLNVKLLADLLRVKGFTVTTAASGPEALDRIAAERPDLVLLDVMMPEMSGYEVCTRIRANQETARLPVVMVTSLDAVHERVKGIEVGADDFLSKPVNQPELLARVRSLLRIKELDDALTGLNRELERRPWPKPSWPVGRTIPSRRTGARSRWCSWTSAASPPSRRRPSPRKSWGCSASTTPRWADSSSSTRARSSASPATA